MKSFFIANVLMSMFLVAVSCSAEGSSTGGNGIEGTWKMTSMNENMEMDGSIFECQIMEGGTVTPNAMNTTTYTEYVYEFSSDGTGTVSTKDTDGNYMEGTPIEWQIDGDNLSITTNVFVTDTRVYSIISNDGGKLVLKLDHTFPADDEFDRGGQRLYGDYTLSR